MLQARSWLPRTEGSLRLGFVQGAGETRIGTLRQAGAVRVRFPRPAEGAAPEAVLLNTAGGLTGGDRIDIDVSLAAGCAATVTSAAAEKVYRSLGDATEIRAELQLGEAAACTWLPQPTILFDGANLDRRTQVHMAGSARLLAVEVLIFGRTAMGEDVRRGAIRDAWRVTRDGRLVFADATRVMGAVADALDRTATLDGARATAMVLYVASDAPARLDEIRALLDQVSSTAGVSTWNNILLVRAAARDSQELLHGLQPIMARLSGRPLPRVWQC
ncbi:MAG: urease accessory protein UreD [Hyphomonadaceae bacterium]|nr:urease accessory protein UreD [Hyphomonadaceae bacterium]